MNQNAQEAKDKLPYRNLFLDTPLVATCSPLYDSLRAKP